MSLVAFLVILAAAAVLYRQQASAKEQLGRVDGRVIALGSDITRRFAELRKEVADL